MSDQGFAGNAGEWGGPGGNAGGGPTVNAGRCLGCGYNLRGLAMDGRCPECGWSISWSLGGARLHHADGLWRQRVGSGLGWLFLANLLSLIGPTGLSMIGSALPTGVIVAMSLALAVGIYGASIGGAWLATDPEPRRIEDTDRVPRQWARWGLVVGAAAGLLSEALIWAVPPGVAGSLFSFASLVAFMIGAFALYTYLPSFAQREGRWRLARHTRWVKWGITVTLGLVLVQSVLATFSSPSLLATPRPRAVSSPVAPGAFVACGFGIFMLVFVIWELVVLFQYRKLFLLSNPAQRVP